MQRCLQSLNNADTDLRRNRRSGIRLRENGYIKVLGEISRVCLGICGSVAADARIRPRMPGLRLTSDPHYNIAEPPRGWEPASLCLNAGNAGTFAPLSGGESQGSRASERLKRRVGGTQVATASEPRTGPGIYQHHHLRSAQVFLQRRKQEDSINWHHLLI